MARADRKKKGTRLTKEGEKVLDKYEKELRRDVKDIRALYKRAAGLFARGEALALMGKYDDALSAFNKVIEIDPAHKSVWAAKANVLAKIGRANEALLCYNRALELDPEDKALKNRKEELLSKIGMPEEKKRVIGPPPAPKEKRRIIPEIVSRVEVEGARVSEKAKGIGDVIRAYSAMPKYRLLMDLARDVALLASVAIFALILIQYNISKAFWNVRFPIFNSIALCIIGATIIIGILYLIMRLGEIKSELMQFCVFATGVIIIIAAPLHETLGLSPFGGLLAFYNVLIMSIGAIIAAIGILLLAKVKGYFSVWLFGALILWLTYIHEYLRYVVWTGHYGTYDQAIALIGIATTFTGIGLFAYNWKCRRWNTIRLDKEFRKGNILGRLSRYEEAIVHYNRALSIDPKFVAAWNNKGNALSRLGRYVEAISCYDEALAINPYYEYALNNKAIALRKMERYDEALECYDRAIKLNPRYREAWENKLEVLEVLGREKEVAECLAKIREIDTERELAERA